MTVFDIPSKISTDDGERAFAILLEKARKSEASREAVEFARFSARLSGDFSAPLVFSSYLVFCGLMDAHACILLTEDFLNRYTREKGLGWFWEEFMPVGKFIEKVKKCQAIGRPEGSQPIVLHGKRLYCQRYLTMEKRLSSWILRRASRVLPIPAACYGLADRLFANSPARPDWQKIAALNSVSRAFSVVSGGPGTGKTRTVAAIVALLVKAFREEGSKPPSIALAAPTGKAAARLTESLDNAISALGLSMELDGVSTKAVTLHRLLGASFNVDRFRFGPENPLPWDAVIVDEASMIDLPMMLHLVEAIKDSARLVLLGDKDQLASVEAGNVLSDICKVSEDFSYSMSFIELARAAGEHVKPDEKTGSHPLRDSIVTLEYNFRFGEEGGINLLSKAVNRGDFHKTLHILSSPSYPDVSFVGKDERTLQAFLEEEMTDFLTRLRQSQGPEDALGLFKGLKVLCGIKEGHLGSAYVNDFISGLFSSKSFLGKGLFKGLPIVIRENDYAMRLFNGDVGVLWQLDGQERLWAFIESEDGIRQLPLSMLPSFEPAWAITVHVSQGSEFDRVLLVLPPESSPLATRQLLYTAITRAKEGITIWGSKASLEKCVTRDDTRLSGLSERLLSTV